MGQEGVRDSLKGQTVVIGNDDVQSIHDSEYVPSWVPGRSETGQIVG